jgi:hypothetical protein
MSRSYSSNWSSINSYFSFKLHLLNQKLKNSFSIQFTNIRIKTLAPLSLWFSISSIIPTHHIDLSFQEKIKPVSIWSCDHLLIHQCIWRTHYKSWLIQILSNRVISANSYFIRARKEHTVYLCSIIAIYHKILTFEIFSQQYHILLNCSKEFVIETKAFLFSCLFDSLLKFLNLQFKLLYQLHVVWLES